MPRLLNIPRTIAPGDTITWRDRLLDYKPPEYSLAWAIRGASALDLEAIPQGDEFETTITPQESSTLIAGTYFYQAYARYGANRATLGTGQITVLANLEGTGAYDGSTTAQKMLALVERAIAARLSGGAVDSYEIKGRRLDRTPLPDLVGLRSQLKIEVQREQAAAGLMPDSRRLFVKFRGM